MDVAAQVIKKLKLKGYCIEAFENPSLQVIYNKLIYNKKRLRERERVLFLTTACYSLGTLSPNRNISPGKN